ncbi:HAD family hydrolase [Actinopolyspora mortivallis]|uniref:HAD family hydrolase n=1 Tax=Actinopolyspora mortivallis TaxID=33906 RepID=A0A2T0GV78_ACTMO|nr:HAD family hydrolase [Actinopolyspora mortivallis]PRW63004.1 HAD family hydrolase [Actinopolyspora mortivallis]
MRQPCLVASDLDGTLLDPSERVSARTAERARAVDAAGVPLVLVTGRPPRWVPRIVGELGVAGPVVCSNGAVHYDAATDTVVGSDPLAPETLREATGALRRALPGCSFGVERSTGAARDRVDEQFLGEPDFHRCWPNPDLRVTPVEKFVGAPADKLLVLHEHLSSARMAAVAEQVLGEGVRVTYSTGSGLLELSAAGVDKASGLARVAGQLGVAAEDVLAFGDMPNDVPMLEWAGHGVAMGNAHPEVRQTADEVTADNAADGVAAVLERWW